MAARTIVHRKTVLGPNVTKAELSNYNWKIAFPGNDKYFKVAIFIASFLSNRAQLHIKNSDEPLYSIFMSDSRESINSYCVLPL